LPFVPETLGHYQLLERIGAGALGEVFRARDTRVGRTVAIKRVPSALASDESRRRRLLDDARAASALSHPHVASLYEVGEENGQVFLAFEHVPGESLAKLIGGRPLNPRRALEIAIQAADALAEAHAAGIVHRDVRPDNIVVTQRGQAKLLDTGLAGFTGGGALRAKAATLPDIKDEVSHATFRYLSPEQALGEPVDHRSDIFSLGAVLYEMLTGKPAFDGASAPETIVAVAHATPAAPSTRSTGVPPALDAVVARALAKSLDRRYQAMAEMAAALREIAARLDASLSPGVDDGVSGAETDVAGEAPGSRSVVVVVAVLVVLAVLAWWLLSR
jgi:eukaryotic-like serine/threonine-protein kinase